MTARRGEWGAGEVTTTCRHCTEPFTYVKTSGPLRIYCSQRCKANAGEQGRKRRVANVSRRCPCGSLDVARTGHPVCQDCRKDKRSRVEYNRSRRLAMYGLTQERFDELVTLQRGRCAICATDNPGPRGWHIDHDHACCPGIGSCGNCVRGLLCHCCNLMLGNAKDSIDNLERAVRYLRSNAQFSIPLKVVK